jgi:RNA polymerase sigma-70 factor, ECF subfamily
LFQINVIGGRQMSIANGRLSPTTEEDEQMMIACARAGDADAFETLVQPHWGALLRVTQRILRNREDAEDTVQTALLNAWRNLKTFQGRSRFSSWLTRIAINCAFMRLRAARFKNDLSLDEMVHGGVQTGFHICDARPNPEHEFAAREILSLVGDVINRLEPHYLEVIEMGIVRELRGKEAAQSLGVPVTTVKSRLYRARAIVAQSMQPHLRSRRRSTKIAATITGCSRTFPSTC